MCLLAIKLGNIFAVFSIILPRDLANSLRNGQLKTNRMQIITMLDMK